jgi:hypothetical protein
MDLFLFNNQENKEQFVLSRNYYKEDQIEKYKVITDIVDDKFLNLINIMQLFDLKQTYIIESDIYKMGDLTILEDIDIYEKVGKNRAYDEFIEFEIKNDKLYFEGKEAKNAYDEKTKNIKLTFVKKEADNPKINALLIVKGTLKDTDYDEYQREQELMEKQKQEFDKKNREFQRMSKSIDFEDFEDDFTDDGKKYRVSNGFFSWQAIFVSLICIGTIYFFFFSKK